MHRRDEIESLGAVAPKQGGRIHIEKINGPLLFEDKAAPAESRNKTI
jgi:hypothetical protein